MWLLLLAACRPDASDTKPEDRPTSTFGTPPIGVPLRIEAVASGDLPEQVGSAVTSPSNGYTYILPRSDGVARPMRYLNEVYLRPEGEFCLGQTIDGACRGTRWISGEIALPDPISSMCMDGAGGRAFLLGTSMLTIDTAIEGDDAYSYNHITGAMPLEQLSGGQRYGPCAWLPDAGQILLTLPDRWIRLDPDRGTLDRLDMRLQPTAMQSSTAPDGSDQVILDDPAADRILAVDATTGAERWSLAVETGAEAFSADAERGLVWVLDRAGQALACDPDVGTCAPVTGIIGASRFLEADTPHGALWVVSEDSGGWLVQLVQGLSVVDRVRLPGSVDAVARPGLMGDLVVFTHDEAGQAHYLVYGAEARVADTRPPTAMFLLTTLEEPLNNPEALPCDDGTDRDFQHELLMVRGNAEKLAGLGIPVALAITDNFTQKAEECGALGIFAELDALGLTLGVMNHQNPCYNCTDLPTASGADICDASDPDHARSDDEKACFPDHPDYCARGDDACYTAHMQPLTDLVDGLIPGGGAFLTGVSHANMHDHAWIDYVRTVDRTSQGRTGFPISLMEAAWAYAGIDVTDPRGKNQTPWRPEDRASAWHLGDEATWAEDDPASSLLYLPGVSTSMLKQREISSSGLFVIDALIQPIAMGYDTMDTEILYRQLRQSVHLRHADRLNTFYFHVHSIGSAANLVAGQGEDRMIDDGAGNLISVTSLIEDLIDRINRTYVATGEARWADVSTLAP